ncbi:MAG: diguanylate cyclase [Magnetococcales bacterium]|nr:diguanylate cyclase [Magnetococcales bacterium]MBF0116349.1 diguanylate cyclase [Magnetococcales bacterium]
MDWILVQKEALQMESNESIPDWSQPYAIAEKIWWVGAPLQDDAFQCHTYLIENGSESILIDPGSMINFDEMIRKVETVLPLSDIRWIICQHQDPDITASLPALDRLITRSDAMVLTHWRAIALLKHYNVRIPFQCIEKMGWRLDTGARRIQFIFTPYLHFPGAFCTFDDQSGILFSSDLFGGFTEQWQLFAQDESYFEAMRPFHEHYMPSQTILFDGLLKLSPLPIRMIAPQHGSIIPEHLVQFMIERLKDLDCGLFSLAQSSTDVQRLSRLNLLLRKFFKDLVFVREFRSVLETLAQLAGQLLPLVGLDIHWQLDEEEFLLWSQENHYQRRQTKPCADVTALFRQPDQGSDWSVRGVYLCYLVQEEKSALVLHLRDSESGGVKGLAIFRMQRAVVITQEEGQILNRMGEALSVAAMREILQFQLEGERQRYYERSIRDPLTNLYTRFYLREAAGRLFEIQDRDAHTQLAFAAFDLDFFKSVNDTYGHAAGDDVLRALGQILLAETRTMDIPVRLGGEEFLLLMVGSGIPESLEVAERIRLRVEKLALPGILSGRSFTISAGVSLRHPKESLEAVMEKADVALYKAKHAGRNRVVMAED